MLQLPLRVAGLPVYVVRSLVVWTVPRCACPIHCGVVVPLPQPGFPILPLITGLFPGAVGLFVIPTATLRLIPYFTGYCVAVLTTFCCLCYTCIWFICCVPFHIWFVVTHSPPDCCPFTERLRTHLTPDIPPPHLRTLPICPDVPRSPHRLPRYGYAFPVDVVPVWLPHYLRLRNYTVPTTLPSPHCNAAY